MGNLIEQTAYGGRYPALPFDYRRAQTFPRWIPRTQMTGARLASVVSARSFAGFKRGDHRPAL